MTAGDGASFPAGGKARAPSAPQAGSLDLVDHALGAEAPGHVEGTPAASLEVFVEVVARRGVQDPADQCHHDGEIDVVMPMSSWSRDISRMNYNKSATLVTSRARRLKRDADAQRSWAVGFPDG